MIKEVPFKVDYPLEIFDKTKKVNLSILNDRKEIFDRNIYRKFHGRKANDVLERRWKLLQDLAIKILEKIRVEYSLDVLSISSFGSSLYLENPGDYDFLVIVRGNVFSLEETEISLKDSDLKYNVGISVKGLDNFLLGSHNASSETTNYWQNRIRDRTVMSLYKRHMPIFGYDFVKNEQLYVDNVWAQVSDLLSNTFRLYYNKNAERSLSPHQRGKKILSRLYEAVSHVEAIDHSSEIDKIRKNIFIRLQNGQSNLSESKGIFDKFNLIYQRRVKVINSQEQGIDNSSSDELELKSILNKTKDLLSKKKIGSFLPVVCKIVDEEGRTVSFSKRVRRSKANNFKPMHAEIGAIKSVERGGKTEWSKYTLYCSLEPCGDCARVISRLGFKRVVYALADPLLAYYLRDNDCYATNKTLFYQHKSDSINPQFQLIFSELYERESEYETKNCNVLDVLNNPRMKKNIQTRLLNYWEYMGLPYEKIPEIISILKKYYFNEDVAINQIRNNMDEFASKRSKYSESLGKWRLDKVKNLSKRLNSFMVGDTILDIGGRQGDLMKEVLLTNKALKKAYITDIKPFDKPGDDPRIKYLLQESNNKLPLPKNSSDTVVLSMVLHHLNDKDIKYMLKSIAEILKKKGRVILIEDTFPAGKMGRRCNDNVSEFLDFTLEEKKGILSFYDWFGNRLMRNRDAMQLIYNYKTMSGWGDLFKKSGIKMIHSEFVTEDFKNPDLYPPKAILVFEKD